MSQDVILKNSKHSSWCTYSYTVAKSVEEDDSEGFIREQERGHR